MQPWALICPTSRGIGLELVRRLLTTTTLPVIATARKDLDKTKEDILDGLNVNEDRVKIVKVDVLGSTFPPASDLPNLNASRRVHHCRCSFCLQ